MESIEIVKKQISDSASIKNALLNDKKATETIAKIADSCVEAYARGNKILWAGNGGSAADAQHMTGELVSKFYFNRPGLPAIALTTDTSILTAISNDMDFVEVFARQVQANGTEGDVFVGISTSGNSKNLVRAAEVCKEMGIITVALVGAKPSLMDDWDYVVKVPSEETPRIQECQTLIGHIICCIIEERIFGHLK